MGAFNTGIALQQVTNAKLTAACTQGHRRVLLVGVQYKGLGTEVSSGVQRQNPDRESGGLEAHSIFAGKLGQTGS